MNNRIYHIIRHYMLDESIDFNDDQDEDIIDNTSINDYTDFIKQCRTAVEEYNQFFYSKLYRYENIRSVTKLAVDLIDIVDTGEDNNFKYCKVKVHIQTTQYDRGVLISRYVYDFNHTISDSRVNLYCDCIYDDHKLYLTEDECNNGYFIFTIYEKSYTDPRYMKESIDFNSDEDDEDVINDNIKDEFEQHKKEIIRWCKFAFANTVEQHNINGYFLNDNISFVHGSCRSRGCMLQRGWPSISSNVPA